MGDHNGEPSLGDLPWWIFTWGEHTLGENLETPLVDHN